MRRATATAILANVVLLISTGDMSAFAHLIAYDGFGAGYTPGNITGQTPAATGFIGSWTTNTATIGVVATGLDYPGLYAEDGMARFTWPSDLSDSTRHAYRALGSYDDKQDVYYFSGLMSFTANFATDANSYARMGFVSSMSENPADSVFGVQWGFQGNGSGGVNAVLRVRDYIGGVPMHDYLLPGPITPGTHLFVVKMEPNKYGSTDVLSLWIDPADFSSEAAAGLPVWQRDVMAWVPSDDPLYQSSFVVDMLVLKSFSVGASTIVGYDEARFGQTWADVVPPVPEPSSALLFLGLSILLSTTRLRRSIV